MLYELDSGAYHAVRDIVHPHYLSVQLQTVLEGKNPGVVFADSYERPETALVFHQGEAGFYFVGNPQNPAFHKDVVLALQSTIPERLRHQQLDEIEFSGDSVAWDGVFPHIFATRSLWESTQYVYLRDEPRAIPHVRMPTGMTLMSIDRGFGDDTVLMNRTPLDDTIKHWWYSWEDFIEHGGGYVAVHGNALVGWCVVTGQSQSLSAIDIQTDARYREQGIASVLASATIGWILEMGHRPYWECMESNIPSRKLAEKCGLQIAFTYQLFGFALGHVSSPLESP